jgi:hypothetical protein
MIARIFSRVVFRVMTLAIAFTASATLCSNASGQGGAGYYTNPSTGIVYQKVTKTVERPVVETRIEQREQTVYRPQTVAETTPHSRTVYTPVVEYSWEPRLHGRWNPFRPPAVAYHHVPKTHWEQRNEVVQRTNMRTEWVAEKRTIEVPQRIVRMQREETTDYQVVGRVAPQQANPSGASSAIASRLRPLDSIPSSSQPTTTNSAQRTTGQGGMRPTELYRTASGMPVNGGVGVANPPALPIFR